MHISLLRAFQNYNISLADSVSLPIWIFYICPFHYFGIFIMHAHIYSIYVGNDNKVFDEVILQLS